MKELLHYSAASVITYMTVDEGTTPLLRSVGNYLLILKAKRCTICHLYLVKNSTCFGQIYCPKHIVFFTKWSWELMHLVGFYYKNISRCTVLWMPNLVIINQYGVTSQKNYFFNYISFLIIIGHSVTVIFNFNIKFNFITFTLSKVF